MVLLTSHIYKSTCSCIVIEIIHILIKNLKANSLVWGSLMHSSVAQTPNYTCTIYAHGEVYSVYIQLITNQHNYTTSNEMVC